jgi:hypothetical protein
MLSSLCLFTILMLCLTVVLFLYLNVVMLLFKMLLELYQFSLLIEIPSTMYPQWSTKGVGYVTLDIRAKVSTLDLHWAKDQKFQRRNFLIYLDNYLTKFSYAKLRKNW